MWRIPKLLAKKALNSPKLLIYYMNKRTKIVATVGPASESEEMLVALAQAGVNVFRLNFSHGTHEDHKLRIEKIRKINTEYGFNCAILQDLQGPKIRVGEMQKERAHPTKVCFKTLV